jgi:Ca2+-binding EF-hand superfamily protein
VEEFFASMDRDFDGRLTFEEFMGEETTLEKLFKNMDKNGDGVVTKKEFMSICKNLTDEQVKMAFSKFDTSGDDKLDYREFCEMIRKKEEERNA